MYGKNRSKDRAMSANSDVFSYVTVNSDPDNSEIETPITMNAETYDQIMQD